jgi:hypothetical protein
MRCSRFICFHATENFFLATNAVDWIRILLAIQRSISKRVLFATFVDAKQQRPNLNRRRRRRRKRRGKQLRSKSRSLFPRKKKSIRLLLLLLRLKFVSSSVE